MPANIATPLGGGWWRLRIGNPGAHHEFDRQVYDRDAMTLQALRTRIGDKACFTVLRTWARVHRGSNSGIPKFIALAQRVSDRDLRGLFRAWLYSPNKLTVSRANGFPPHFRSRSTARQRANDVESMQQLHTLMARLRLCGPLRHTGAMSSSTSHPLRADRLRLSFPQSLAVYDDYAGAQKAVDFLSDREFPVENCMIVGTHLKQIERVTGRLTWARVATGGILSGLWLGVFVGLIITLFDSSKSFGPVVISTAFMGAVFGLIWALVGYAATRGRRDFTSVTQVVATKYEVLVENKYAEQARELLTELPGGRPNPFAN